MSARPRWRESERLYDAILELRRRGYRIERTQHARGCDGAIHLYNGSPRTSAELIAMAKDASA
jgi:hypothetical protein